MECGASQSDLRTILLGITLGSDLDGSEDDRLLFHHFRAITVVDFVRLANPSDFWSQRVLPLCHREPAVRHAVIALGAAHHFYLQKLSQYPPGYTNTSLSHYECVATQHYNKAIKELVQFNDTTRPTPFDAQLTVLTCCLLFVCLENILGRFDEGMRHMKAGARLFETANLSVAPHESRQLMQEIATMLLRFNVDATLLIQDHVIPDITPYAKPLIEIDDGTRPFLSLAEAKEAIWDLDVRMSYLDFGCSDGDKPGSEDCSADSDMSKLAAPFKRWKSKFYHLVSSLANPMDLRVDIQREILALMLRRCTWDLFVLLDDEVGDEEQSKICYELVDLAESLYRIETSWSRRPIFTLDGDSIPALNLVALISKDTALVRRIIVLLRESRRREGCWDSWKVADDVESELKTRGEIACVAGS